MKDLTYILLIVLAVIEVNAQNKFTNGGGDHDWHNPNNWSDNVVPEITDDIIISSGSHVEVNVGNKAFAKSIDFEGELEVFGELQVKGGEYGIYDGTSQNFATGSLIIHGKVEVLDIGTSDGIRLTGSLQVESGELIVKDIAKGDGVICGGGYNYGLIQIEKVDVNAFKNIENAFTNYESISIQEAKVGISILNGNYFNEGVIILEDMSSLYLGQAQATFTNDESLIVKHYLSESTGLLSSTADFVNNSYFKADGFNSNLSIYAGNYIVNEDCGRMVFNNVNLNNVVSSSLINNGYFRNNLTLRSIDNYGFISGNSYSNLIQNFSGSSYFFTDSDHFEEGVVGSDFMEGNSNLEWTDELYIDSDLSISAGQILVGNIFLPTSDAVGFNKFYCEVDNGIGCSHTVEVNLRYRITTSDNIYLGGVDGDWEIDSNWSKGHVPQQGELVRLNNTTDSVTINSDIDILGIYSEGKIRVESDVSVSFDSYFDTSLELFGSNSSFINYGTTNISNNGGQSSVKISLDGNLINYGNMNITNVNGDGVISSNFGRAINNLGNFSILNAELRGIESPNLINSGELSIVGCGRVALECLESLYNSGVIEIDGNAELVFFDQTGLILGHETTNTESGSIDISNMNEDAINVKYIPGPNKSILNNYGNISCSFIKGVGLKGSDVSLTNYEDGSILIYNIELNGIEATGATSTRGFDVNNFGHIQTYNCGLLYKAGDLTQDRFGFLADNESEIINEVCGILDIDDYLEFTSTTSIINDGIIIGSNEFLPILAVIVENNGLIIDKANLWSDPLITQNNYTFEGFDDVIEVGSPVEVFNVGSAPSLSFSDFYQDRDLSISVGSYNMLNNKWSPTASVDGLVEAFVEVQFATCQDTVALKWDDPASNPCVSNIFTDDGQGGYQGDWNDSSAWSLGVIPSGCDTVIIEGNMFDIFIGSAGAEAALVKIDDAELFLSDNAVVHFSGYDTPLLLEGTARVIVEGNLNIDSQGDGIKITDSSSAIDNYGEITIDTDGYGILMEDESEIYNRENGNFVINGSNSNYGLHFTVEESQFYNYGTLNISGFDKAIYFEELCFFNNYESGIFLISDINTTAIELQMESELSNYGILDLSNSPSVFTLSDGGSFRNRLSGEMILKNTSSLFGLNSTLYFLNLGNILVQD